MSKENKPDHQHFIPRSYLKNFALHVKKKRFVEVIDVNSRKKLNVSTKDICVSSGLYTLPPSFNKDPYELEKYYAEHVDATYPEIYELLTNKEILTISNNQKHKILNTLLSFYFRTPKVLNALNNLVDKLIDRAIELTDRNKPEIKIDFEGEELNFLRTDVEKVKAKLKEKGRQSFISNHLKVWHEFVSYRYKCALSVFEIDGEIDLITSDNPVSIHSSVQNSFNLFDPTNIIQVPLDRKHYLLVYPNTEEPEMNKIHKGIRDKYFALTTNLQTEKNAENWVIGFPKTVEKHFEDQKKHGEFNEENLKAFELMKQKTKSTVELVEISEKNGFYSPAVAEKINQYRKLECFKGDHELNNMVSALIKEGFLSP